MIVRMGYYATLLAGLALLHIRLADYAFDDAYLHVRIAEHLITHGAPYFNRGEAIMGSSSPLWTLVLAAVFGTVGTDLRIVALGNALFTTLCVWVYATLLRRSAGRPTCQARYDMTASLVLVPILAPSSLGLMETPLALLSVGVAMLLVQQRRPTAFVLFGMSMFLRLELAAVLVVFAAAAVIIRKIRPREVVIFTAIGAAPFVAYDLYFFGTIVPAAVRAKSIGYSLTLDETIWRLVPWSAGSGNTPALVLGLVASLAGGWYLLLRQQVDWTAVAAYLSGIVILTTYVATRTFVFEWYIPLYTMLISWPILAVLFAPTAPPPTRLTRLAACAGALVILILPAQVAFLRYVRAGIVNPAYAPAFAQGARVRRYREIGRELYRAFPNSTLLTSEVGGLGYVFRGRIQDGFGLISPDALAYHPLRVPEERISGTIGAIPPAYIQAVSPPIIVSYDIFIEAFLRSDLVRRYVLIQLPVFTKADAALAEAAGVSQTLWGIQSLHVFVRRDMYDQLHYFSVAPR